MFLLKVKKCPFMSKVKWNDIKSRLTGFSALGIGLEWLPPVSEREVAEQVVTFLENEGLLYVPLNWEYPNECFQSADKIRDTLTQILVVPRSSKVFANGSAIRMA